MSWIVDQVKWEAEMIAGNKQLMRQRHYFMGAGLLTVVAAILLGALVVVLWLMWLLLLHIPIVFAALIFLMGLGVAVAIAAMNEDY